MTKNELKAKTTSELLRLQESDKKRAIELINEGEYIIAIKHLDRAEDIECILEGRNNNI